MMPTLHRRYTLETLNTGYTKNIETHTQEIQEIQQYKRYRRYGRYGRYRRSRKLTEERASPPNSGAKPERPMFMILDENHGAKPSPPDRVSIFFAGG